MRPLSTNHCRSVYLRWLSNDALTRSDLEADTAGGLSLYDLGGPFLFLAAVVSALLVTSVAKHCIQRRRASLNRLPGAKLVTTQIQSTDINPFTADPVKVLHFAILV